MIINMMINKITSRKNQLIKSMAELNKSAEKRKENNSYIAEGARLVEDAALSGVKIFKLFYTDKAFEKYKQYIIKAQSLAEESYVIEEHVVPLLSTTKSSQGVFALCGISNAENQITEGRILVLENIQDPSNLGAVLRTAEAMGISNLVLCGNCCDLYNPKTLRASMGAVFRINFVSLKNPNELNTFLTTKGYKLYGTVPDRNAQDITGIRFDDKSAVAIGNEGNGLTEEIKLACDALVTIPMRGRAESLNAATAASIVMWEMAR